MKRNGPGKVVVWVAVLAMALPALWTGVLPARADTVGRFLATGAFDEETPADACSVAAHPDVEVTDDETYWGFSYWSGYFGECYRGAYISYSVTNPRAHLGPSSPGASCNIGLGTRDCDVTCDVTETVCRDDLCDFFRDESFCSVPSTADIIEDTAAWDPEPTVHELENGVMDQVDDLTRAYPLPGPPMSCYPDGLPDQAVPCAAALAESPADVPYLLVLPPAELKRVLRNGDLEGMDGRFDPAMYAATGFRTRGNARTTVEHASGSGVQAVDLGQPGPVDSSGVIAGLEFLAIPGVTLASLGSYRAEYKLPTDLVSPVALRMTLKAAPATGAPPDRCFVIEMSLGSQSTGGPGFPTNPGFPTYRLHSFTLLHSLWDVYSTSDCTGTSTRQRFPVIQDNMATAVVDSFSIQTLVTDDADAWPEDQSILIDAVRLLYTPLEEVDPILDCLGPGSILYTKNCGGINPVAVRLKAALTEYALNCPPEDDCADLQARFVEAVNDWAPAQRLVRRALDNHPPTTDASVDATPNAAGWFNESPLLIDLVCTDAPGTLDLPGQPPMPYPDGVDTTSGCRGTYYGIDDGPFRLVRPTGCDVFGGPPCPTSPPSLEDGITTLDYFSFDNTTSNREPVQRRVFRVDSVPPPLTVTAPGAFVATRSPTVTIVAADATSGVDSVTCSTDGSTFADCGPDAFTPTFPSDGAKTVTVTATDVAGLETTASASFLVDTTPPTVTFASPVSGASVGQRSITLSFSAADNGPGGVATSGVATTTCSATGIAAAPCASPHAFSFPSDGPKTLRVVATDAAGNSAGYTRDVFIDTVAPTVSITPPLGPSGSRTVRLAFSFSDAAPNAGPLLATCGTDGLTHTACVSPHDFAYEGDGPSTAYVRVMDAAGNVDEATATFTIDTGRPEISIAWPIEGSFIGTRSPDVAFSVHDPDPTSGGLACTTDGVVYEEATCESPAPFSYPSDGPQHVTIKARDAAGNEGQATHNFHVDTAPPATSLTRAPSTPSPSGWYRVLVTVSSTCGDGSGCSVTEFSTNGGVTYQSMPAAGLSVDDGVTNLLVRSTDALDHVEEAQSMTVRQDLAPPITTLDVSPPSPDGPDGAYRTHPTVTLSCGDAGISGCAGTLVSWDGGPLQSYTAPFPLPDGEGDLKYYSLDAAGWTESVHTVPLWVETEPLPRTVTVAGPSPVDGGSMNPYVATAWDAHGDEVQGVTFTWSKSCRGGSLTPSSDTSSVAFTAPTMTTSCTLRATVGAIYGSQTVSVVGLRITGVGTAPNPFTPCTSPGVKDVTTLAYTLNRDAAVTIKVYNSANAYVRTLKSSLQEEGGSHTATWDGRNGSSTCVPNGTYTFRITAIDALNNAATASRTVGKTT